MPKFISTNYFYGWDLLFKTIQEEVYKKADLLIALIHFVLTKHCQFRCIGVGDSKFLTDDDSGSELLPDGWNVNDHKYALRYVHNKCLYLVLGYITEDTLIINMLDMNTKKLSNICIEPELLVVEVRGDLLTLIPTASQLVDRFRRELLDPIYTGTLREVATQTVKIKEPKSESLPLEITSNAYEPRPFGFPDIARTNLTHIGSGFKKSEPAEENILRQCLHTDDPRPPNWGFDKYL